MSNPSLENALSSQPHFRLKQIYKAWFDLSVNGYGEITTLPITLREKLKDAPWLCVQPVTIVKSKVDSTVKALLRLRDREMAETVLMGRENKKAARMSDERYTVCVSSQAGCPMGCVFCATGFAGFRRNLRAEEIVDQYRFWERYLNSSISNIVIMGQGEPLLNYDNIKKALNIIIENADIGPTNITLSTCGVRAGMERMLKDKKFPAVRFALSLHSAVPETRQLLMPTQEKDFLNFFVKWAGEYHKQITSRSHFVGLEYIMLSGINDDGRHLEALIKFAKQIPRVRINLIPYNFTKHVTRNAKQDSRAPLYSSSPEKIKEWHDRIMKEGFVCTVRRSQGQDIAAACGQLRNTLQSILQVEAQS